jgi:uncharacterized protein YndB with AHSA1/START domain
MSSQYNWTQFTRKVYIAADINTVFRAWATPSGLVKWFIAQADYHAPDSTPRNDREMVQVGDTYYWRWHQDLETTGEVLNVVENECFQVTFGNKEATSNEKIIVTVHFHEEGDETLVELTQSNMADTPESHAGWHLGCNMGWSFFMTNLKGLLEHGIDLRETEVERAYASRAISH